MEDKKTRTGNQPQDSLKGGQEQKTVDPNGGGTSTTTETSCSTGNKKKHR
jgi:hypothetical protein